ncbi:hypothetical protein EVAR_36741_1 [Eumeta japonica]|uniref:Uncharacterized protein n=1 Tax=Eumeta variegata TaxID=151549 RepID=A0A4C1X3Z4_EUMVA|nr:hypothetical protein EVAR_36741_1 [Eumeta japonica]
MICPLSSITSVLVPYVTEGGKMLYYDYYRFDEAPRRSYDYISQSRLEHKHPAPRHNFREGKRIARIRWKIRRTADGNSEVIEKSIRFADALRLFA